MKVFISWSGPKSKAAAEALRDWLPKVIQAVTPFISSHDIPAGARGENVMAIELAETDFGIVCVTAANQREPWINFEAGALAKSVSEGRVIPLALDLPLADVKRPLGQFQAKTTERDEIREVVQAVTAACSQPLDASLLDPTFEQWWPDLERALDAVQQVGEPGAPAVARSEEDKIDEVLQTVRALSRSPALGTPVEPLPGSNNALRRAMEGLEITEWALSRPDQGVVLIETREPLGVRRRNELERVALRFNLDVEFGVNPQLFDDMELEQAEETAED
jgi:hypothetical protein